MESLQTKQQDVSTITVAELMRRRMDPPSDGKLRAEALADDVRGSDSQVPESVLGPTAIAIAIVGILLLCGGTAAGSIIIAEPAAPAFPPAPQAGSVHGAFALRPKLIRRAQWPSTGNGGLSPHESDDVTGPASAHHPEEHQGQVLRRTGTPGSASPDTGSCRAAHNVVEEFYRRLGANPAGATHLLAPRLLAGYRVDLQRAWEGCRFARTKSVRAKSDVFRDRGDRGRVCGRNQHPAAAPCAGQNPLIIGVELLHTRLLPPR